MDFDLRLTKPDYHGGSIVNLMATLKSHYGGSEHTYSGLKNSPSEALQSAKRVILLVIDGLGADLLEHWSKQPGSSGIFREHLHCRLTSVYPPTTASAVTSLMNGQAPQQHGLTGWFMNFREIGATVAVLPFISRYGRQPLNGVDISALVDCHSLSDGICGNCGMLLPEDLVDSDFSRRVGGTAKRTPYNGLDDFVAKLNDFSESTPANSYLYAYWSELDRLSHLYGPSDPRVETHFLELQNHLQVFLDKANRHNTCVLITADHGFLDSGPDECIHLESHPALKDMLAMPLFGEPRSAYCVLRKGCDDEFEDYIKKELSACMNAVPSESLIANNWFGLGEPHPELTARVGDYTLQMKERFTIRDRLASEAAFDLFGMHGGITAAEQYVPLMVFPPA